jgi:hypothetical protein
MAKIDKVVKTRKSHKCSCCESNIPRGSFAIYTNWKGARYDDNENQIGVEFHRNYYCFSSDDSVINNEEFGIILMPECT